MEVGTPHELYHSPRTRFVAGFIGSPAMNFLPCKIERNGAGLVLNLAEDLSFSMPADLSARYGKAVGKPMIFGLRPEHITEPRGGAPGEKSEFTANLDVVEPMGMETMVFFRIEGTESAVASSPRARAAPVSRCGSAPTSTTCT